MEFTLFSSTNHKLEEADLSTINSITDSLFSFSHIYDGQNELKRISVLLYCHTPPFSGKKATNMLSLRAYIVQIIHSVSFPTVFHCQSILNAVCTERKFKMAPAYFPTI